MKSKLHLQKMKHDGEKITMMTAYDFPSAKLLEKAEVDMILVGDSLGMVMLGYDSTIKVTVDDMIHHGKAVRRGAKNTFIAIDMPFMSYHISMEDSLKNAKRIFQETDAQALKIEGSSKEVQTLTTRLTQAGIPVIAHIGLTPQSVNQLGGFRVQGKTQDDAEQLIDAAKALEASGAMMIVLECIPKSLAEQITSQLTIPTIGIGAGVKCDGQVIVFHDVLRYGVERLPKFVKPYHDLNDQVIHSLSTYVKEVKEETFPDDDHSYL